MLLLLFPNAVKIGGALVFYVESPSVLERVEREAVITFELLFIS